jgi:hypothetical protein
MSARGFTHPDLGREARVEQWGREVRLIFVCGSETKANDLVNSLVRQMKAGALNLTLMGKPTSVIETGGGNG